MPYETRPTPPKGTLRKPAGGNPWKNRTPTMDRPEVPAHYWRSELSYDDEVSRNFRSFAESVRGNQGPSIDQPQSLYELVAYTDSELDTLGNLAVATEVDSANYREMFLDRLTTIGWACTAAAVNLGWIKPSNGFGEVCPGGLVRPEPPFNRMPMPGEARRFVQSNPPVPAARNFREAYGLVRCAADWVVTHASNQEEPYAPAGHGVGVRNEPKALPGLIELYVTCWQVSESLGLVKENR